MLAKTAGVKHLVILINKMDDSTVAWNEERYNVYTFFYLHVHVHVYIYTVE